MPFKRFAKKTARKAVAFAKKRYTTRTGGARVNKIARDVMKIKRSLNVEHKHFDYNFGASGLAQDGPAQPTRGTPVTLSLPLPERGVAYNNRVGNQIRITHITSKIQMTFYNSSDRVSRTTASVRLLFAKSGVDVPSVEDLYELDQNGFYSRSSFTNTQEFKKYAWIKSLNSFKSVSDQVNRYPLSNSAARAIDEGVNPATAPFQTTLLNVDEPSTVLLNERRFYINKQTKTSIRVMFQNGSDTIVDQMKPYLLIMSDVPEEGDDRLDRVIISGQIRFTYVDN